MVSSRRLPSLLSPLGPPTHSVSPDGASREAGEVIVCSRIGVLLMTVGFANECGDFRIARGKEDSQSDRVCGFQCVAE